MRKFLVISTVMFVIMFVFNRTFIKRTFESIFDDDYFSKTNKNIIEIKVDDEWTSFNMKGVNLGQSEPGMFENEASDYMTKEDYLRWIKYISDMNANVIRVNTLMPESFYTALDEYNRFYKKPIYILQGIYIEQSVFENGNDVDSVKFDEKIKKSIGNTIDYIHGESDVKSDDKIDSSEYVLGYTIGTEWLSNNIVYYEIMNDKDKYKGKYFETKNGSSSFEAYLCSLADYLVKYESKNYNKQSLISFVGTSPYKVLLRDTFVDETIDMEDRKVYKDYVDVENIQPTDNFKTGIFVSYNMYPSFSELLEYENDKSKFLKEINDYHDIPVVISEYGVPSARTVGNFTTSDNKTYITEEDQANLLKENYEIIRSSECAGSFINNFQDNWSMRSWNTAQDVVSESVINWCDAESYSASFGLLAFEAGNKEAEIFPDDSDKEWIDKDIIDKNINITFSSKQDEKYMYFYIKNKAGLSLENKDMFINLDITPNSGSNTCNEYNLRFDRNVDFIIRLNGTDNSRVMVQEYYNTKAFGEYKSNLLINPDENPVYRNTYKFSNIELNTTPKIYLDKQRKFSEEENIEVGKLLYGNANPSSTDYNSCADFYYGEDYVEVRIPWSLINFMDPSNNLIKGDFYESLSINPIEVQEIYAGLTIKNEFNISSTISSKKIELEKWETPTFYERLKPAYYTMKEVFSK